MSFNQSGTNGWKRFSSQSGYQMLDTADTGAPVTRRRSGTDPTGYSAAANNEEEGDYYMWRGTGWENDTIDEHVAARAPTHVRFGIRDLEANKMAHRFTEPEEVRMAKFESIDYWEPNTKLFRDSLEEKKRKGRGKKWVVYAMIGFFVGILSFSLLNTVALLSEKRRELIEDALGKHDKWYGTKWGAFSVYLSFSILLIGVSTGICGLWAHAAGSGVPDVMAYLNGVTFPKVFNIKTLACKILSCALAVAGGLPVGPEGPIIHVGALVGAGLGTGRSRTLGRSMKLQENFRNPKDHRDFITGGACAGVACAFSAPIGGLLFVVEEMSSFFSKKSLWMAFFASLTSIVTTNSLTSKFEGWQVRDGLANNCTSFTSWNSEYTILFKANSLQDVNLMSVPLVILLGIICGLFGALFTFINIKVSRFRMTTVNKSTGRRMLEPVVILVLFMTLMFLAVSTTSCEKKPPADKFDLNAGTKGTGHLKWFDAICDDPETEYHPLGTLSFASAEESVKLLFRRGLPNERLAHAKKLLSFDMFGYGTLAVWFLLYFTFACWSAGTYLSCGLVIPMLIMGSSLGRFYGLVVSDIAESIGGANCQGVNAWVDPGVFALFGAAGFFAGVSRLTFSLCVIIVEITGDIPHLPNVMICAMVAKNVADIFTHPLYHALLDLKCVPFLDMDMHLPYLDAYSARDLIKANKSLVALNSKETVASIVECLYSNAHNAFPIVVPGEETRYEGAGIFRGTVLRSQLEQLLWFLHDCEERDQVPQLDQDELIFTRERIFWERLKGLPFKEGIPESLASRIIDLTPITNTSAFCVPDMFSVSATYNLFRGMGMRHLVVVNKHNSVIGILTRKDLVAHTILKNTYETRETDNDAGLPSNATDTFTREIRSRPLSARQLSGLDRQSGGFRRVVSPCPSFGTHGGVNATLGSVASGDHEHHDSGSGVPINTRPPSPPRTDPAGATPGNASHLDDDRS